MHSEAYIERLAREQYQLVPVGLQAFVVKGLPLVATHQARRAVASSRAGIPLLTRLEVSGAPSRNECLARRDECAFGREQLGMQARH